MSDRPVNTQSMPRVNSNTSFAQRSATQARPAQSFRQFSGQSSGQASAPRMNNAAPAMGQRSGAVSNGVVNNNSSTGWRTFNGGAAPGVIGGSNNGRPAPVQPQVMRQSAPREVAPRESAPQRQNYQQPVRISPPIVRERSPSPQVSRPQPSSGGFGAPRPQSGGGGGNRSSGGGGGNRSSGGGGSHGGGGHQR